VVEPEVGPLVALLFEWFATGRYSLTQITKKVRLAGLKGRRNSRPIAASTAQKVLRNRFYKGAFDWVGVTYAGVHEPLVSSELWDVVQETSSMPWNRRFMIAGRGLIHHSDRGSQYVSIKYTERLAEAGIEPSVGSVGDSYDNALAETINGLYKAEVIHRRGPWRSFEAVEYATLEWVDWFNHRRLLEPIGNIPPAEAEDQYYAAADNIDMAA
jgi:hypothetical protein